MESTKNALAVHCAFFHDLVFKQFTGPDYKAAWKATYGMDFAAKTAAGIILYEIILWRACNLTSFSPCLTGPVDYPFASCHKGPGFKTPGGT